MATNLNITEYVGVTPKSDFDLAGMVEAGLPTESLTYLKHKGLSFSEIHEIVIPPRTLKHRKSRNEPLSNEETDRFVRVARTLAQADAVFGNHVKALGWLRMTDEHLAGRTPLSMLQTEAGGRLIESMLWQIDEGVYS